MFQLQTRATGPYRMRIRPHEHPPPIGGLRPAEMKMASPPLREVRADPRPVGCCLQAGLNSELRLYCLTSLRLSVGLVEAQCDIAPLSTKPGPCSSVPLAFRSERLRNGIGAKPLFSW